MRRPQASNPQTLDPLAAGLAGLALASSVADARPWRLGVSAVVALLFLVQSWVGRGAIRRPSPPLAPTLYMLLALVAIILGATRLSIGGGNPLWLMVTADGPAAIDLEGAWIGGWGLGALALAFVIALRSGATTQTARSIVNAMMAVGMVLEVCALVAHMLPALGAWPLPTPLLNDASVRGSLFGILVLIAAEALWHDFKGRRQSGLGALLKRSRLPLASLLLSVLSLLLASTAAAVAVATCMALLFAAWTFLSGGGKSGVPRRVLIWLSPTVAALAAVVAVVALNRLSETPFSIISKSAHWNAFWASPWLGYGMGSQGDVANLFMTRANLDALVALPDPPQAYLSWLEQGGVLGAAPLLLAIGWCTGLVMFGSLGSRRISGLMRCIVCASLFLSLLGLSSAGPAAYCVELVWVILLGLGVGAARSAS